MKGLDEQVQLSRNYLRVDSSIKQLETQTSDTILQDKIRSFLLREISSTPISNLSEEEQRMVYDVLQSALSGVKQFLLALFDECGVDEEIRDNVFGNLAVLRYSRVSILLQHIVNIMPTEQYVLVDTLIRVRQYTILTMLNNLYDTVLARVLETPRPEGTFLELKDDNPGFSKGVFWNLYQLLAVDMSVILDNIASRYRSLPPDSTMTK